MRVETVALYRRTLRAGVGITARPSQLVTGRMAGFRRAAIRAYSEYLEKWQVVAHLGLLGFFVYLAKRKCDEISSAQALPVCRSLPQPCRERRLVDQEKGVDYHGRCGLPAGQDARAGPGVV